MDGGVRGDDIRYGKQVSEPVMWAGVRGNAVRCAILASLKWRGCEN